MALCNDVKGLNQRHPGFHHSGELSGENRDVERCDGFLALPKQGRGLFTDLVRIDPLPTQLRFYQRNVLARQFTLDLVAALVGTLPDKHLNLGFCCLFAGGGFCFRLCCRSHT